MVNNIFNSYNNVLFIVVGQNQRIKNAWRCYPLHLYNKNAKKRLIQNNIKTFAEDYILENLVFVNFL